MNGGVCVCFFVCLLFGTIACVGGTWIKTCERRAHSGKIPTICWVGAFPILWILTLSFLLGKFHAGDRGGTRGNSSAKEI